MSKTEFRQVDLDALGYPKGDIRDWLDAGHIKASITQADGAGTRNVYSRDDVLRIIALRALVRVGFTLRLAIKILDLYPEYLNRKYGVIDPDGPSVVLAPGRIRGYLEDTVVAYVCASLGMDFSLSKHMIAWNAGVREKSYDY